MHVVSSKAWRVKPYRKLTVRDLHSTRLNNQPKLTWKPIFTTFMLAPGVSIPSNQEDIDEAFVKSSYAIATEHLNSHFSCIFAGPHSGLVANYTIGTWSKKVQTSQVMKHGTEEDKAKLPPPSNYNHEHKQKRTLASGECVRPRKIVKRNTGRKDGIGGDVAGAADKLV